MQKRTLDDLRKQTLTNQKANFNRRKKRIYDNIYQKCLQSAELCSLD